MKTWTVAVILCFSFKTTESLSQTWQPVEDVCPGAISIAINPQNDRSVWFGCFGSNLSISYDGGKRASRFLSPPSVAQENRTYYTSVFIHPRDTSFVMIAGSGCYKSFDYGNSWSQALPDSAIFFNGESIAYEQGQSDTLYTAGISNSINPGHLFFRSVDRGQSWQVIDTPFLQQRGFCSIAAGGDGLLLGGRIIQGEIWRSTDFGETWIQVYAAEDSMMEIPKITFDRVDSNIVWATVWPKPFNSDSGHVVKSIDRGLTWTAHRVFGSPWAIETDNAGRVFVGMLVGGAPGAIMSSDGGKTWTQLSLGLPDTAATGHVWMLKSDGSLPGLYMADTDIGAYKLDNVMTSVSSTPNLRPHQFNLLQNYPNPFNPATTIRYSLASARHVTLKIFDILGREVTTLVDEFKAAGDHRIDLSASQLTESGVYFLQMTAGDFRQTRKLVFVQ